MTMIPAQVAYKMNLPVWKRFTAAAGKALSLARSYVEDHVPEPQAHGACPLHGTQGILQHMIDSEHMDKDEVGRIITDLFLAAADTTSHATQWALYMLAKHPESQEKVLAEVQQALGNEETLREEHLANLPYVKGVIKESLRLFPVAPYLTRALDKDIELNGYRIPRGKMIVMSLYSTGRNEKYFKSAESFRPERWMRNKKDGHEVINSYAYLPFGLGTRSCIGRRVAEVQMQLLLARVVQKFSIAPGNTKEIGIKLRLITTPEEPIRLKLKLRASA